METTKARREAAVLFFIVFVLGALFGAVGVHVWAQRVSGEAVATNIHPHREQMIDSFSQQVQLTAEQRQQLAAIMDDTVAKWTTLYAPLDGQREAIRQQGRDRIRAILTPEQVPKFEDYMRRVDEQRKKDAAASAATASH